MTLTPELTTVPAPDTLMGEKNGMTPFGRTLGRSTDSADVTA